MIKKIQNQTTSPLPPKTVAAIHDLSGFGRCALTVVIPVLSAMGLQPIPMPTALLSTHTGDFQGFSFLDLSDQMEEFAKHWHSLGLTFDAIYSGFLGSERQVGIVSDFIDRFRRDDTIVIVDPVLGDDGIPYATITPSIRASMGKLAAKADILTPNITEAGFLLSESGYKIDFNNILSKPSDKDKPDEIPKILCDALDKLGASDEKAVVITGLHSPDGCIGNASSGLGSNPSLHMRSGVDVNYPGTGDIFASVLLGRICAGDSLSAAAEFATGFVRDVIYDSSRFDTPARDGVLIERHLHKLYTVENDSSP